MATEITSEVVKVSPEMAEQWLEKNKMNRPLRPRYIEQLASSMRRGLWKLAQPIIFAPDGWLLDGQHRLSAIVVCGKTIETLVVRGVQKNNFGVIDQGRNRSASDLHQQLGGINSKFASAVASSLMLRATAAESALSSMRTESTRFDIAKTAMTYADDIARVAPLHNKNKAMVSAPVCAAVIRASECYGWNVVEPLAQELAEMSAPSGSAINALCKWLNANTGPHRRSSARMPRSAVYGAVVTAMHAAVHKRPLSVVKPTTKDYEDLE